MWEALSSPALCHAGGAGAAARCGAGTSSHRGGVGPPCGPRGPPAAGPHAEGPHLLGGEVPACAVRWGGLGWGASGAPLSLWPLSPPGSEPWPEARSLEVPPGVPQLGGLSRGAQGPRAQENVSERSSGRPAPASHVQLVPRPSTVPGTSQVHRRARSPGVCREPVTCWAAAVAHGDRSEQAASSPVGVSFHPSNIMSQPSSLRWASLPRGARFSSFLVHIVPRLRVLVPAPCCLSGGDDRLQTKAHREVPGWLS